MFDPADWYVIHAESAVMEKGVNYRLRANIDPNFAQRRVTHSATRPCKSPLTRRLAIRALALALPSPPVENEESGDVKTSLN